MPRSGLKPKKCVASELRVQPADRREGDGATVAEDGVVMEEEE